jgi:ACS family sodium-dependent inorganic phosphate cotransporter
MHHRILTALLSTVIASAATAKEERLSGTPWKAFISSRPVQALTFTHFCNNWGHFTAQAWMPTYLR